jgi:hypothetical protein
VGVSEAKKCPFLCLPACGVLAEEEAGDATRVRAVL